MMPAHSLLAVVLGTTVLTDPAPLTVDPQLTIGFAPYQMVFHVSGPETPFIGAILGSLEPDLMHFLTGLPPLLANATVLDVGFGDGAAGYTAVFPELMLPAGVFIHVQGLVLDEAGLQATAVQKFVLDVTVPK